MTPLEAAASVLVGCGAVLTAWFTLGRGIRGAWRFGKRLEALHGLIERELSPNGGGSMKDKLDRIEAEAVHARDRHHDIISNLSVVKAQLEMHIDQHPGPKRGASRR